VYDFVNISDIKFSVNGRQCFKTFIPFYIDSTHICIFNIYDSKLRLVAPEHVSRFTVNGASYSNATSLINVIHPVLFSRAVGSGDVDLTDVWQAITDLQNIKSNNGHTHDDRYYTESEIDAMFSGIGGGSEIVSGVVDNDKIKFYNSQNQEVFQINAKALTDEGTILQFDKNTHTLKLINAYGETLSTSEISAKESYYDVAVYFDNISPDLDFIQSNDFVIAKTTEDDFYFISLTENLNGCRLFINETNQFFDLNETNKHPVKNAWKIEVTDNFISGSEYMFNKWSNGQKIRIDGKEYLYDTNLSGDIIIAYNVWFGNELFDKAKYNGSGNINDSANWQGIGESIEF